VRSVSSAGVAGPAARARYSPSLSMTTVAANPVRRSRSRTGPARPPTWPGRPLGSGRQSSACLLASYRPSVSRTAPGRDVRRDGQPPTERSHRLVLIDRGLSSGPDQHHAEATLGLGGPGAIRSTTQVPHGRWRDTCRQLSGRTPCGTVPGERRRRRPRHVRPSLRRAAWRRCWTDGAQPSERSDTAARRSARCSAPTRPA
jgi:hypothetical protein